jgi:hypothetical protein
VPRSASAPSHGAEKLKGVEMEKPEAIQGKEAPKIVLVKRSSLQQRPSPGPAAASDGSKPTTVGSKKSQNIASKTSPSGGLKPTAAAFGASASTSIAAANQQLPVLSFGAAAAAAGAAATAPSKSKSKSTPPNPLAKSFEPTMYGSTPQLLSAAQKEPTTSASSFLLVQARANWSSSAVSAEAAAAAYALAKGNTPAAATSSASGYDEIGYTDAWASIGQHFTTNLSPTTSGVPPLSPSFGAAAAFNALSPSGPFDGRVPSILSTETSLGLSLLPADTSLSSGLSSVLSGRTGSSLPLGGGTGELLASLQQIWEGPPSAEGSLTPPYSSHTITPQTTPLSAAPAPGGVLSSSSPLGELLPSAGLTRLASLSSPSPSSEQPTSLQSPIQWLGNEDEIYNPFAASNFASNSSLSFRSGNRAHSGSLADLGFEETSEF